MSEILNTVKIGEKTPLAAGAEASPNESKGDVGKWWRNHAREVVEICTVFINLTLAFSLVSAFSGNLSWSENSMFWILLITVILILSLSLWIAARRTAEADAVDGKEDIYVLSQWSLRTLKAEQLPTDIKMCLNEVFVKGTEPNTGFAELAIRDSKDRSETSWLGQLEANLGSARVNEFETLLLKYTRRQNH